MGWSIDKQRQEMTVGEAIASLIDVITEVDKGNEGRFNNYAVVSDKQWSEGRETMNEWKEVQHYIHRASFPYKTYEEFCGHKTRERIREAAVGFLLYLHGKDDAAGLLSKVETVATNKASFKPGDYVVYQDYEVHDKFGEKMDKVFRRFNIEYEKVEDLGDGSALYRLEGQYADMMKFSKGGGGFIKDSDLTLAESDETVSLPSIRVTPQVKAIAKKLYSKVLSKKIMDAALLKFKKAGDVSHAHHEKAVQFVLETLTDLEQYESEPFYDVLRGELNDMISAGLS